MRVIGESVYEEIRRKEVNRFAVNATLACIDYARENGTILATNAMIDSFYKAKRDAELSFDEDNGGES